MFEIIPSIDIKDGKCVRLYQGDYEKQTVFSDNPVEVAYMWQTMGADRIHIVDLDGAATGTQSNVDTVRQITREVNIPIQVGGGIRDIVTASNLLDMGVERVIFGTVAVENPGIVGIACRDLGIDTVVVTIDCKDGLIATRGWRHISAIDSLSMINKMTQLGVSRFIYTDISRDGTLTSPNFESLANITQACSASIISSGGVTTLEHLNRVARCGADGAIIGMALYTGDIDLKEAILAVNSDNETPV